MVTTRTPGTGRARPVRDRRPPLRPAHRTGPKARAAIGRPTRRRPGAGTRQRPRSVDSGSGRQDAIPVELGRMIVLVAFAILAITVVLPALLELAAGPFR